MLAHVLGAFGGGFVIAYCMTHCFSQAGPLAWLLHPMCCLLYGVQVAFAWSFGKWAKRFGSTAQLIVVTTGMLAVDYLNALWLTPIWIATNPCFAIANTPIIQLMYFLTAGGVSAMIYFCIAFMFVSFSSANMRICSIFCSVLVFALMWITGSVIEQNLVFAGFPINCAVVQPHVRSLEDETLRAWVPCLSLTSDLLEKDYDLDLVVWPESALTTASYPGSTMKLRDKSHQLLSDPRFTTEFTCRDLVDSFEGKLRASVLAGEVLVNYKDVKRFGVSLSEVQRYNCGVLINPDPESGDASLQVHQKQALVPIYEYIPDLPGIHQLLALSAPTFRSSQCSPGNGYATMSLSTKAGLTYVDVAICYESWLPWLDQFSHRANGEVIVHLAYDGEFSASPGYAERLVSVIRMRAIETRKWQVLCSTWSGSCVVAPNGSVCKRLPAIPGVLVMQAGELPHSGSVYSGN